MICGPIQDVKHSADGLQFANQEFMRDNIIGNETNLLNGWSSLCSNYKPWKYIFTLPTESGTWYFTPTFSIINNFCSRLLIQVEQAANKGLINCFMVQFKFVSTSIYKLKFRCKDCKVYIGTSGRRKCTYFPFTNFDFLIHFHNSLIPSVT